MILTLLKKSMSLLLTALLLLLLLVAVYVSLGRQLLPYVDNYRADIQAQLSQRLGQAVHIAAIEGDWHGFNPVLSLRQVLIAPPGASATEQGLQIQSLALELNVWASLLNRRWLLTSIDIENAALTMLEDASGRWQLQGIQSSGEFVMSPDQVLDLVSRVRDLSLSNTTLVVQRADGRSLQFERSRVRFQNHEQQHFLHIDAWQRDVSGPLSLSAELLGNRVADLSGQLYFLVPDTDYSEMLATQFSEVFGLASVVGNGELWMSLQGGQLQSVQGNVALHHLALTTPARIDVEELATQFFLQRDAQQQWSLWLEKFGFVWNEQQWRESELFVTNAEGAGLSIEADLANLTIASGILVASDFLGAEGSAFLSEQNLRGELANTALEWLAPPQDAQMGGGALLRLQTNLVDVAFNAQGSAPAISGIDGYSELLFDSGQQRLTGFAEVDSSRISFQLPRLFEDVWEYERVNGRVSVDLDVSEGVDLKLSSGVIVATSAAVTGRAQFSLHAKPTGDANRIADLELMVGVSEGDISRKALYLPRAPGVKEGLRNLMTWLDGAIIGGTARDSGLVFRGSVLPDAEPSERSLQMYFNVTDGSVRYEPQWPLLEGLHGYVVINEHDVDISVSAGQSLGLGITATSAQIRPNQAGAGNWLTLRGMGEGDAQAALAYLREMPVTRGFGDYIADWRAQGEVALGLGLQIPLGIAGASPQVAVDLQLRVAALTIPEFALDFSAVQGRLAYNTSDGLTSQGLGASLFDQPVAITLSSRLDELRSSSTRVEMSGSADVAALRAWPKQSDFVVDLLGRASGEMDYTALLEITQPAQAQAASAPLAATRRLTFSSNLQDVVLAYPAPFLKAAEQAMPMRLTVDFLDNRQDLSISLADIASLNIGLSEGRIRNGLIILGQQSEGVSVRRLNASAPGLDVLGTLQRFDYEEWMAALRDSTRSSVSKGGNFSNLRDAINAVDVTIADAYAFGQNITDLNLQIASEERDWRLSLASAAIAGEVRVPYAASAPLDVALSHLRFPAPETLDQDSPAAVFAAAFVGPPAAADPYWQGPLELPRVDALAGVDPRDFPYMKFRAESVSRGELDYGRWQFLLEPNTGGAVFSSLLFDIRGIRAGKEGEEARFVWTYDGVNHHSYFSSVLEADNIGAVLSNFGYAPSLESSSAQFHASLDWPGSPAFFAAELLSGDVDLKVLEGRFLQSSASAANGALKLISIINFDALVRRLRFSDDLLRSGLSYEQINGSMKINDGIVEINDRLQIIGPASLFQVSGQLDLAQQTIDGYLYITLPLSDNIPWMSGIAVLNNLINWQLAVGVFLFDQIFGDQVDSLTSAQYTLQGPWEGLEPRLNQVFGTPGSASASGSTPATPPKPN